jgi:hypothetical protein
VAERHKVELRRFTSMLEYLREVDKLLQQGEALVLVIPPDRREQFENEVEGWRSLGRVKVVFE